MRLVLNDVRLAFPKIVTAEPFPGGKDPTPYFSASGLLPPNHPQIPAIRAAIKEVATKKWPTGTGAILQAAEAMGKLCLKSGDLKPDLEGYPGNLVISARTKATAGKPKVYGLGGVKAGEIQPGVGGFPYAGCYVRMVLTLFAYGGVPGIPKGVGAGLGDIQFMRDGDAFSGGAKAASEEEFGDISTPIGAEEQAAAAPATAGSANPWD